MKQIILLVSALLSIVGTVAMVSCGDSDSDDKDECQVGTVNCPCLSGACNGDLECEDDVCVEPTEDSETEEPSDSEPEDSDPEVETPTTSEIEVTNDGEGKICAEGVVVGPFDDIGWDRLWGAGFGINFCQDESNGDKIPLGECPRDLSRLIGVRLTVTGELPSELRIQFEDNFAGDDDVKGDNGYIVAESVDEPADYLFEDAAVFYLSEDSRPELHPELFTSLQIQIAAKEGVIEEYSFCIEDIEVILSEDVADGGVGDDTEAVEESTDPACADPTSLQIIPASNGWVAGCSNAAELQGDLYSYSDPG